MWHIPLGELAITRTYIPLDPPAYQLFYTALLMLVMGTTAYLVFRKIKNRNRVQMPKL